MVSAAEQAVLSKGKLIAWYQRATAGDTPEAVDVVDLGSCPHHEVVCVETETTP